MFLLQRIDLAAQAEIELLYWAVQGPSEGATELHPTKNDQGGLSIPAGGKVSFESYFNSFFENYWFAHTHLESVTLQLQLKGRCTVSLWRQTPHRDVYLLERREVDASDFEAVEFTLRDDDELRVEAGRVWFEISAAGDTELEGGGWFTTDEPARPVELGVVFCTFNREKYLGRILNTLDSEPAVVDRIGRFFVVNQGNPFQAADLLDSNEPGGISDKLTIIEQDNLGGCGGFTRGMVETYKDPDLTHFVLLDDDIRVHPDSLLRCASFLAFAHDDVSVGGHMLNLHRPNYLFEAGARLHGGHLQPDPIGQDTLIAFRKGLQTFLRAGAVSYNGWWFFAASKSLLDEIGFPMPCFIRGDDIEFGMRIEAAGKKTVPVPGIAVWHEPFYLKLGNWQLYFETRNRLMSANLHGAGDWSALRKNIGTVFARDIAMSRYHSARLIIEALRDYEAGPEACFVTDDEALQRCRAIVAEYGPERVESSASLESRSDKAADADRVRKEIHKVRVAIERRTSKVGVMAQTARRLALPVRAKDTPVFRAADLSPSKAAGADRYIVQEEHGGVSWLYERDPELERKLWREFAPMLRRLGPSARFREAHDGAKQWHTYWDDRYSA